jgi:hypothetical protein
MTSLAVQLRPLARGWSVALTDGRELARFTGLAARWRAERYATAISAGSDRDRWRWRPALER